LNTAAGRELLPAVAARHELAVITSNKNQDLLDNRHPHYAGHLHNATPESQLAALDRADLILAVGTRLYETTTRRQRLPRGPVPNQPLVHVYPDAARLGLTHRPTLGIACDPARFLAHLLDLPATGGPHRRMWTEQLHRIEEAKSTWEPCTALDGVVFGALVSELDELTGGEVTVVVDSGTFTSWVYRYLRLTGSGRLLGLSSSPMGFGVPAGIAAARRLPDRPVVVVVGDGGFLMNGNELITAVAERLPVVVIVANNNSYATIRRHQERLYPGRCIATDLVNPNFSRLAEAFGAIGIPVAAEPEIRPALRRALDATGPVLLDVRGRDAADPRRRGGGQLRPSTPGRRRAAPPRNSRDSRFHRRHRWLRVDRDGLRPGDSPERAGSARHPRPDDAGHGRPPRRGVQDGGDHRRAGRLRTGREACGAQGKAVRLQPVSQHRRRRLNAAPTARRTWCLSTGINVAISSTRSSSATGMPPRAAGASSVTCAGYSAG
jgi:hypothetical protein